MKIKNKIKANNQFIFRSEYKNIIDKYRDNDFERLVFYEVIEKYGLFKIIDKRILYFPNMQKDFLIIKNQMDRDFIENIYGA